MRLKNKNVLFFTKLIVFGALFMMILHYCPVKVDK